MSKFYKTQITCPNCSHENDCTVWESINTTLNPQMKESVRNGAAFQFVCPNCKNPFSVVYGFLYHQMEDKLLVHYCPDGENFNEIYRFCLDADDGDLPASFRKRGYRIRIVTSLHQFQEKLKIFDAGLDDRVIEIIKTIYLVQALKDDRQSVDEVFFYQNDQRKYGLVFLRNGIETGTCAFSENIYRAIEDKLHRERPDIVDDDIVINRQWALRAMRKRRHRRV